MLSSDHKVIMYVKHSEHFRYYINAKYYYYRLIIINYNKTTYSLGSLSDLFSHMCALDSSVRVFSKLVLFHQSINQNGN